MNPDQYIQKEGDKHPIGEVVEKLVHQATPPEDLKDEVFNSLDTIHFVSELADLFTNKFALTKVKILEGNQDSLK